MAMFNDLYWAVVARDCARLRQLVRGGIDVDSRDSMKRTVLHHAALCLWGEFMKDEIQTLVDLGADINAADLGRRTPLLYSISEEAHEFRREMIRCVIKKQQTQEETTAKVEETITHIRISAFELLVGLGADINARFDHKVTSLHRAIQLNNIRGIETLLRLGVDVNAMKWINCTMLHVTLDRTETTLMKCLVELGADVNAGFTLLPPLFEAVKLGRMDIIKMLVQHGAEVDNFRKEYTPVTYAVEKRYLDVLKILAQCGADLNAKQFITSFTVNEIVKVGRVDILKYLVRHKEDLLSLGSATCRFTALGLAVHHNSHEMVDCLLKNGADVNGRYDITILPLTRAIRLRNTDMVTALAMLQPNIFHVYNVHLCENITALYHSCRDMDLKIMELLLKYGGDVNLRYDDKVSPVNEAVAQGNGEMVRVLTELGADLNFGKGEGKSLINHIRYRQLKI